MKKIFYPFLILLSLSFLIINSSCSSDNNTTSIDNKGKNLNEISSLISKLKPKKNKKLPKNEFNKGYISIGTQKIPNVEVESRIGKLYFFTFKPGGFYFRKNYVLKISNETSTIGTWDNKNIYFKKSGDISIADKNFNRKISLNDL